MGNQQSSKEGSNSDMKKLSEYETPRYSLDMDEKNQLSNVKVIWVIGAPGSGKGTQLKKISEKYNCPLIGYIDINEISENTDIGKEIKTALEAFSELFDYIFFDGAPRDSSQVGKFEENIKPCDLILNLKIDKNTCMTRIQQRAKNGSDDFSDDFSREFSHIIAKIEGRIDDQDMKRVENRIDEYLENIGLVLKETRDRNYKYVEIDADRSEDEVFKDICNEIEKLKENNNSKQDIVEEGITMDKILEDLNLIHSKLDLLHSKLNLLNAKLENLDPMEKKEKLDLMEKKSNTD